MQSFCYFAVNLSSDGTCFVQKIKYFDNQLFRLPTKSLLDCWFLGD